MRFLFAILALLSPLNASETGGKIVVAARKQVGVTTSYIPDYEVIPYPDGDVARSGGVCTDVIVRALRDGLGQDLQKLVHEDMRANFSSYPKNWGLKRPDRNIDHRRVLNLQTFFKRRGFLQPVTKDPGDYLPGDLVTCTVPPNLPHVMVVSDKKTSDGVPLAIHNIGAGAQEENVLFTYPLTGHYRWKE